MLIRTLGLSTLLFLFAHAASAGGHLYWSMGSAATGQIQRCDVDACVPETIVSGIGAIGIDVDPVEREIYWADVFVGQIRKATETGASNQLVHQAAAGLGTNLAVDPVGRKVYWNQNSGIRVARVDLDGSNLETFLTFVETGCAPAACSPQGIDVDGAGGFVYWADAGNNVIRRKSTTLPATLTTIVTLTTGADSLQLDVPNDRVFILDGAAGLEEGALSSPPNAAVVLAPGPFNTTGEGIALDEDRDVLYMLSGAKIVSCPASDCDESSDLSDFYDIPGVPNGLTFLLEPVVPVPALSPIGISALVMILGLAGFAYSRRATRLVA